MQEGIVRTGHPLFLPDVRRAISPLSLSLSLHGINKSIICYTKLAPLSKLSAKKKSFSEATASVLLLPRSLLILRFICQNQISLVFPVVVIADYDDFCCSLVFALKDGKSPIYFICLIRRENSKKRSSGKGFEAFLNRSQWSSIQ